MESGADEVKTVVIEVQPGWVCVKIANPRPAAERVELLLKKTIEHWFGAHPNFVIDRTENISDPHGMQGFNVYYHEAAPQYDSQGQPLPPPGSFVIEILQPVLERYGKEYAEAVVEHAIETGRWLEEKKSTQVFVNPRQVVFALDWTAQRGMLMPLAQMEPVLNPGQKLELANWLAAPQGQFFVTFLPGSWLKQT